MSYTVYLEESLRVNELRSELTGSQNPLTNLPLSDFRLKFQKKCTNTKASGDDNRVRRSVSLNIDSNSLVDIPEFRNWLGGQNCVQAYTTFFD